MSNTTKPPAWFWIVSSIALVWNLLGVLAFASQVAAPEAMMAALPEAQRAYMESLPTWYMVAFGVAVFGGLIGCLLLLLRKRLAFPILVASLIGVLFQHLNTFVLTDGIDVLRTSDLIMAPLIPIVSILLIWLAKSGIAKGWLS